MSSDVRGNGGKGGRKERKGGNPNEGNETTWCVPHHAEKAEGKGNAPDKRGEGGKQTRGKPGEPKSRARGASKAATEHT